MLDWVALGIAVVVLTLGIKIVLGQAFFIPSRSMVPQLEVGDRIVVSRMSYRLHGVHRGDVVVFDEPSVMRTAHEDGPSNPIIRSGRTMLEAVNLAQPSTDEYVKRVIGLPGDVVEGKAGSVYVNGRLLIEPYLQPGVATSTFPAFRVQESRLWVMGDNRPDSLDSRVFSTIPRSTIVGRVVARVWPLPDTAFL